jgi:hypothetical protein
MDHNRTIKLGGGAMIRHGSFCLGLVLSFILIAPKHSAHNSRAVPHTIVFAGPPLHHRIVLRDFAENQALVASLVHDRVVSVDTVGRAAIDVAIFYVRSAVWTARPPDSIPFAFADARSRYYPALDKHPALLLPKLAITGAGFPASIVSAPGQRILARHGIPTGPIIIP